MYVVLRLFFRVIDGTLVRPCIDIYPSVAVAASVRVLTFYLPSVSVCAFPKMASSTEKQAKECGGSSPLHAEAKWKIAFSVYGLFQGLRRSRFAVYKHAEREQFHTALFGTAEEGVEPDGFQAWVPFAKGPSFALSIGFHYTNIATETLKLHWLVHAGHGIWRSSDQLSTFVLLEAHTQNSVPASMTDDLKLYGSLAEFENVTGVTFNKDGAKLLMKWCAPEKPPAYVMLRNDESVQYSTGAVSYTHLTLPTKA